MPDDLIDKLENCLKSIRRNAERRRIYDGILAKECEEGLVEIVIYRQEE